MEGDVFAGVEMKDLEEQLFDRSPNFLFKGFSDHLSDEEKAALKKLAENGKSKTQNVTAWDRVYRLLFREIKTE